jgi:hypothetical protein
MPKTQVASPVYFIEKQFLKKDLTTSRIGISFSANNMSSTYKTRINKCAPTSLLVDTRLLFILDETKTCDFFIKMEIPTPKMIARRFYQACWQVIAEDIMVAILAIWSRKFRNFGPLNTNVC